jgi:hypothetical protein
MMMMMMMMMMMIIIILIIIHNSVEQCPSTGPNNYLSCEIFHVYVEIGISLPVYSSPPLGNTLS